MSQDRRQVLDQNKSTFAPFFLLRVGEKREKRIVKWRRRQEAMEVCDSLCLFGKWPLPEQKRNGNVDSCIHQHLANNPWKRQRDSERMVKVAMGTEPRRQTPQRTCVAGRAHCFFWVLLPYCLEGSPRKMESDMKVTRVRPGTRAGKQWAWQTFSLILWSHEMQTHLQGNAVLSC